MTRVLLLLALLLAAGAAALPVPAAATGEPDYLDLYRWGEYDSLIRMLEPRLVPARDSAAPPAFPPEAERAEGARAHLCLGVAYWATGREADADRVFRRALRLDADQRLDPLYSTGEMRLRLESLGAEEGLRVPEPVPAGAAGPAPGGPAQGGPAPARPAPAPAPALGRKGAPGWLLWTGAALATGAAGLGTYFLAQDRAPRRDSVHVVIDPGGAR